MHSTSSLLAYALFQLLEIKVQNQSPTVKVSNPFAFGSQCPSAANRVTHLEYIMKNIRLLDLRNLITLGAIGDKNQIELGGFLRESERVSKPGDY